MWILNPPRSHALAGEPRGGGNEAEGLWFPASAPPDQPVFLERQQREP